MPTKVLFESPGKVQMIRAPLSKLTCSHELLFATTPYVHSKSIWPGVVSTFLCWLNLSVSPLLDDTTDEVSPASFPRLFGTCLSSYDEWL
jgi:hypothetical protein